MTILSKNHTISKFIAKLLVRLFILLLLFAFSPFILEDDATSRLNHASLYIENKWVLIFPGLLFLGFLGLLILALRNKYQKTDINWLLSLNTVLLVIYVVMLYIRIFPLVFG